MFVIDVIIIVSKCLATVIVSSTRLYVDRISSRTRAHDLERLFSRYGRFLGVYQTWGTMVLGSALLELVEILALCIGHFGDSFCSILLRFSGNGNNLKPNRRCGYEDDFAFVEFSDP
ncbi:uncharacterized protein LOC111311898 [Durio zibethinus]|uniref:Uncharacterized protein LOC111311898 n=1 Tax=Durio zibethinus TaxID=66656 RepID=A0A6P6ARD1_DURZI|nr:uncharacterized protein LOC111311898 [Durio zibethinus]